MIQKALEYIVGLSEAKGMEIGGRTFTDKEIFEVKEPTVVPLCVGSLTGVVQYIKEISQWEKGCVAPENMPLVISIGDQATVSVERPIYGGEMRRQRLLTASFEKPQFKFGEYYDAETFNIKMQSVFLNTDDKESILKVIGNLKEESVRSIGDDGVSQSVTAKVGIATVSEVKVPNPVKLRPYRTFFEAGQPESQFVFRMQQGGRCALFEADGGEWKEAAKKNIYNYLELELADAIKTKDVVLIR